MLRIGTLGAARITPAALLAPAADLDRVDVVAVAAREHSRAVAFAQVHGIAKAYGSYDELLADEQIDAVYNPLPNSAHGELSMRALRAGKHVLCEKPLALNAREARTMVDLANELGLVLMEAFHWRYHPAAARCIEIAKRLGRLERGESAFMGRVTDEGDIRFQLALGGGATMDLGCYCIHALRVVSGEEPEVDSAAALERPSGVDLTMDAELRFPSGLEARIRCSFDGPDRPVWYLVLEGSEGRMRMENPFLPHRGNRLTAEFSDGTSIDEELTRRSSYHYQLEAFEQAVRGEKAPLTGGSDAVANMAVIDAVYATSGLGLR
ncbi:MAG: Gfo/Idh/MocA family oxidoreductase [Actinomycetota bacterium]|nr:Gfo/Idh/MocA family oxidoreductase [Actinomycetota bacterium]